ncbi:MAG TPA: hypothetical protein VFZ93_14570 [Albitalea sp.]
MPEAAVLSPYGRGSDLLQLARAVESEQPSLASELRGIAMHEASAATQRSNASVASWWRRLGRDVWEGLEAFGRARAQRQVLALAERWETTQPELAKELRAACTRM